MANKSTVVGLSKFTFAADDDDGDNGVGDDDARKRMTGGCITELARLCDFRDYNTFWMVRTSLPEQQFFPCDIQEHHRVERHAAIDAIQNNFVRGKDPLSGRGLLEEYSILWDTTT